MIFFSNCKSLLGYASNTANNSSSGPSAGLSSSTGTGLFTPSSSATASPLGTVNPNSMMHGGFYVLFDEAQEQLERELAEEEDDPFKLKRKTIASRGGSKVEWR